MGKFRKKWTNQEMLDALEEVRKGRSVTSVSKEMGIPKSTIATKMKGTRPIFKSVGPASILSSDEEAEVVHWIQQMSQQGFPITKSQLTLSVGHYIKRMNRETPFKDGIPGRHWYESFLRRCPEVTALMTQNQTATRACVTATSLRNWFTKIQNSLDGIDLTEIKGSRIFNFVELGFSACPKSEFALARKEKSGNNFTDDECISVILMTNALGSFVPPMIVYPYERIPYSISQSVPNEWSHGKTENGRVQPEVFYEYMSTIFEPWLTANNIQRPVTIFADGHTSVFTQSLMQFCATCDIELIGLHVNATHVLQPLDVGFLPIFQTIWSQSTSEWSETSERKLRREDFAPIFKKAIDSIDLQRIMCDAFRVTGLYPFTADALNYGGIESKKNKDNVTGTTAATRKAIAGHLNFIEENIEVSVLNEFRETEQTGIWVGNLENLGLFMFWKKIYQMTN